MSFSPTCVDLFAGCGGLSLGLKQAGFNVELAVEKSPMAAETYYHNFIKRIGDPGEWLRYHQELPVEIQAKSKLVVSELANVLASEKIIASLCEAEIDLVAGGPPCQGFSLAGRRNPKDARNKLPWQFLEFVEKVRPKAVIIENVSGMQHDFRKHGERSPFDQLRIALSQTEPGYVVQPMLLNAMHFGAPQHRPRVFLVGIRSDVAGEKSVSVSEETWDSALDSLNVKVIGERPFLAPRRTHFDGEGTHGHLTVKDAIADLCEVGYNETKTLSQFAIEMRTDTRFLQTNSSGSVDSFGPANHVVRRHSDRVRDRFRLYQFFRDAKIHPNVLSIRKKTEISDHVREKLVLEAISHVEYPVRNQDGSILAKDQRALERLVSSLSTRKHSQRALSWGKPAPTVVSLPDDLVHPEKPRIPTVRELARFQTFPDAFEFRSKETTGAHRRRFEVPQYTQVGNAVPPRLAKALGERLYEVLNAESINEESKEATSAVA